MFYDVQLYQVIILNSSIFYESILILHTMQHHVTCCTTHVIIVNPLNIHDTLSSLEANHNVQIKIIFLMFKKAGYKNYTYNTN